MNNTLLNLIELYSPSTLKALTCGRCVELVFSLQNSFFSSTYIRISTLLLNSIIGRYYLFYGVSSLAAKVDGLDTPPPPKCTSLVYLYSDMWRSFDVGLYNYIHREKNKLLISLLYGIILGMFIRHSENHRT